MCIKPHKRSILLSLFTLRLFLSIRQFNHNANDGGQKNRLHVLMLSMELTFLLTLAHVYGAMAW